MLKKSICAVALLSALAWAKEDIVVFHAGSLAVPFGEIEKEFEALYPQYDVKREASGSIAAARKVTELKRKADVVASADYAVIDTIMIPQNAKFNALFATNEMAIAYTKHSKYAHEINAQNWTEIFLKEGVKVGHSNPNLDPCGYRSILVTKLAQTYYQHEGFYEKLLGYEQSYKVGDENKDKIIVRPKETDLLGLLEAKAYDYLFIYKSVAIQHGLNYITLPEEISLKNNQFEKIYQEARFNIDGKKPNEFIEKKGEAMVYSITIPENEKSPANKAGAVAFVKFVLSSQGQAIMQKQGQDVVNPVIITGDASILEGK
jgi:molybdate/tungstate transport system substrate-binding protein